MKKPDLYMCLIGCKPEGRHIEQHDIFFGIASSADELIRQMEDFWPDGGRLHLDAWRKVTKVEGMKVEVMERESADSPSADSSAHHLYFINLGGYQPATFEEFHHKMITVQPDKTGAIRAAKASDFYMEANGSHIDDQYGVDIDDLYDVEDILPAGLKEKYYLRFVPSPGGEEDSSVIGYTKLAQLPKMF